MPTTFVGLLIFVLLLAPGFLFVVVVERGPFSRGSPSVLRETASIALTSLVCDVVAVLLYSILAGLLGERLPSVSRLIKDSAAYWQTDGVEILASFLVTLLVACLLAVVLAASVNQTDGFAALERRRPLRWVIPDGGARSESAWWFVLRRQYPERFRRVTCFLVDGSTVRGWLASFNPDVTETEDREVILSAPIRVVSQQGVSTRLNSGYVTISARQMKFMHVDYYERTA